MTQQERIITTDDVDHFGQCCQLEALLPRAYDNPQPLKCRTCGRYLGCMANSRAIAVGHFNRRENQWSRLIGGATILGKKVLLECPQCGSVKRWYRTQ